MKKKKKNNLLKFTKYFGSTLETGFSKFINIFVYILNIYFNCRGETDVKNKSNVEEINETNTNAVFKILL